MPVITQGRKQFIVPLDTLFGWKSYNKKYPDQKIIEYNADEKALIVEGINSAGVNRIKGRKW